MLILAKEDVVVIEQHMSVEIFKLSPIKEQKDLLKRWREGSTSVLTVRDVPSLHNDGDMKLLPGRDF